MRFHIWLLKRRIKRQVRRDILDQQLAETGEALGRWRDEARALRHQTAILELLGEDSAAQVAVFAARVEAMRTDCRRLA